MTTFFMLGDYSSQAIKKISAERTQESNSLIEKFDGEVKSIHALLGGFDLIIIADFPSNIEAMKASIAVSRLTGISFSTYPAIAVEKFDELNSEI